MIKYIEEEIFGCGFGNHSGFGFGFGRNSKLWVRSYTSEKESFYNNIPGTLPILLYELCISIRNSKCISTYSGILLQLTPNTWMYWAKFPGVFWRVMQTFPGRISINLARLYLLLSQRKNNTWDRGFRKMTTVSWNLLFKNSTFSKNLRFHRIRCYL